MKYKIVSGTGAWLYISSGGGSLATYTYSYANMQPNTTYYLCFAYGKDGSGHKGSDRLFISTISFVSAI